jgi:transposase
LCVKDARGAVLERLSVVNREEELARCFARLQARHGELAVAAEGSSFFWAFARRVEGYSSLLVMAHAAEVKSIAQATLKTDRVDAERLAELLRLDALPSGWMADERTRALRGVTRLRRQLVKSRTQWKNQVRAALHREGAEAPAGLWARPGRAWLEAQALPAVGAMLRMVDTADELARAEEKSLRERVKEDARMRWLETIPGVGVVTAAVIVAELGDAARFRHAKEVAAYAGLVPVVRQSAGKRLARGHITKAGSPALRHAMIEAAWSAVRTSPEVREWFLALGRRKAKNVAIVAVARRLLMAAWALLKHGECFDPARFAAVEMTAA